MPLSCPLSCQVGKALDVLRVDVPLGFDKEPDLSIYTEVRPHSGSGNQGGTDMDTA